MKQWLKQLFCFHDWEKVKLRGMEEFYRCRNCKKESDADHEA